MYTLHFRFRFVQTVVTLLSFERWPQSVFLEVFTIERRPLGQNNPFHSVLFQLLAFDWQRVTDKPVYWKLVVLNGRLPRRSQPARPA